VAPLLFPAFLPVVPVNVEPEDPVEDPESPIPEVPLAAPVPPAPEAPVLPVADPVPVFIFPGPSLLDEPFAFPDPIDPPFSLFVSIVFYIKLVFLSILDLYSFAVIIRRFVYGHQDFHVPNSHFSWSFCRFPFSKTFRLGIHLPYLFINIGEVHLPFTGFSLFSTIRVSRFNFPPSVFSFAG